MTLSLPPRNDLFKRFSQYSRKNTVAVQSTSLTGEKEPGGCGWNERVLSSSRGGEKGAAGHTLASHLACMTTSDFSSFFADSLKGLASKVRSHGYDAFFYMTFLKFTTFLLLLRI